MPYISTRTNTEITPEISKELKTALGKAIGLIPGKSETWLMVENIGNCDLYFKGDNSSTIVYAEVKLFGEPPADACDALTAHLCELYSKILNTTPDKVYVKYEAAPFWGWNGVNF